MLEGKSVVQNLSIGDASSLCVDNLSLLDLGGRESSNGGREESKLRDGALHVDGEVVFIGSESVDSSECEVVVKVSWLVAEKSRLRRVS